MGRYFFRCDPNEKLAALAGLCLRPAGLEHDGSRMTSDQIKESWAAHQNRQTQPDQQVRQSPENSPAKPVPAE
ncbi:hypothetical protein JCM17844_01350 [Iodidimonas gelatinilytica]|uniref:Uncharacterized protein n=1 Tax=Iodidimonas gelatinilytica TaxID=1236966 RepID=A0A5A7MNF8_9PROT|nr:hypothetical protein JCM17844_01350 [Iodidimonas gelatinilytica]